MSIPNAPEPDPAAGSEIAAEAAAARADIKSQLSDGSLKILDLFQMSGEESGASHRVVGHMRIRAALLALPHIGEMRADEILVVLGISGDRHIDDLGSGQAQAIAEAVEAFQPG